MEQLYIGILRKRKQSINSDCSEFQVSNKHQHLHQYHPLWQKFTHIAAFTNWWYSPNIGGREADILNMQKRQSKGALFYLQALSAKVWSLKGRRGKEKHFTCEATGGIQTWDLLVCSRRRMQPPGFSVTAMHAHTLTATTKLWFSKQLVYYSCTIILPMLIQRMQ